MDRPVSAASSATGARSTTASHIGHTRNASAKHGTRPAGPSMPALFVTNLRLLDIDRYPDWPNITVSAFQDARGKIKCSEYALYQLFRLYDPATTADKLQPFFPPLEPLQSVNLRAALYRCLNELKKNGVLGRDTVLRKTMLDECQGDKFWEVCLAFSTLVLKRVTMGKKGRVGRPLTERMGMAQSVTAGQKESMLPLAIAHKAGLSKVLEEKQRKRETYAALYDVLAQKEDELRQRKVRSEDQARKTRALQPPKLNAVETIVTKNWIGSAELRDALVEGDTCAKGDGMLVKSFDDLWRTSGTPERTRSGGAEIGLLQSLNHRALEQDARLRKWQNYHDKLTASKPASAQSSRPASGSQKSTLRFDRHRELNLRDDPHDRSPPMHQRRNRHASAARYDEILTAMREELRKTSSRRNRSSTSPLPNPGVKRAKTQPMPLRRPSLAPIDASPGATDPQARSPTAVPMRFGMGRRVASRSRSYQQPKVDGQREPIQLKSELFSPLKGKRSSTASSILSLPLEEEQDSSPATNGIVSSKDDDTLTHRDVTALPRHRSSEAGEGATSNKENNEEDDRYDAEFKKPALPLKPAQAKGPRPSLADRTRQSMAFTSTEDTNGVLPDAPSTASTPEEYPEALTEECPIATDPKDRRTTLLERTRQSISLAPPAPPKSKKPSSSHARSRTSVFPVNQFETPKKGTARRSTVVGVDDMGADENARRDITPLEDLLSPEAEYGSVFKSRPKIALSPVLTPFSEGVGRMSEGGVLDG